MKIPIFKFKNVHGKDSTIYGNLYVFILIFVAIIVFGQIFRGCRGDLTERVLALEPTPRMYVNHLGFHEIKSNIGKFVIRAREEFDIDKGIRSVHVNVFYPTNTEIPEFIYGSHGAGYKKGSQGFHKCTVFNMNEVLCREFIKIHKWTKKRIK